jgi:hypothetical protein
MPAHRRRKMTRRPRPACLLLLLAGCVIENPTPAAPGPVLYGNGLPLMSGNQVAGAALDLRAFAAELAFTLPAESREVLRAIHRTELARREAMRLGISVSSELVEQRMDRFEQELRGSVGEAPDLAGAEELAPLDRWSQERYGQDWEPTRQVFAHHVADNLRYQLVLRASSYEVPRLRLLWLVARDEATAQGWQRSIQAGRDPMSFLGESLLRPPLADGSWPPLPLWPGELLAEMGQEAQAGSILGPLRFPGDATWRVAFVLEVLPPSAIPPQSVLLDNLEARQVDPLEARAWFEAMSLRYTASNEFPSVQAPKPAFVPLR